MHLFMFFILCMAVSALAVSCGTGAAGSAGVAQGAPAFAAGLPWPPAAGALGPARKAAEANNYQSGRMCWSWSAGTDWQDSSLGLDATEQHFAWAMYSWGGLHADNYPLTVRPKLSQLATRYWLACSDYSRGRWSISGPHQLSETAIPTGLGEDMVSPEGCSYLAVIVEHGHSLTVEWLNLTTSLEGGKIYVDSAGSGGNGSISSPFVHFEDGIAAAQDGDVVVVAPGIYMPLEPVIISRDIRIEGAGAWRTLVQQQLIVENPPGVLPVVVEGLQCTGADFSAAFPAKSELQLLHCALGTGTFIGWSDGHRFTMQNCHVGNSVAETELRFANNASICSDIIRDCVIYGTIRFSDGDGAYHLVEGNYIGGNIEDSSQVTESYFLNNTLFTSAGIIDNSGGVAGKDDEIIANNQFLGGYIICNGQSARVEGNYFDNTSLDLAGLDGVYAAITCKSGTPTNIIGNTILQPEVPFDGDLYDGVGEFAAINSSAGAGVIEYNTISKGSFGIFNSSGATSISYNTLSEMQVGIYGSGVGHLVGNVISGCTLDGMILLADAYKVQDNTISNCLGSGVRIVGSGAGLSPPDLGGGALGCSGRNTLLNNGEYALVMETTAADLPQLFAANNYWGTVVEGLVAAKIYDGADSAGLTQVVFMPLWDGTP